MFTSYFQNTEWAFRVKTQNTYYFCAPGPYELPAEAGPDTGPFCPATAGGGGAGGVNPFCLLLLMLLEPRKVKHCSCMIPETKHRLRQVRFTFQKHSRQNFLELAWSLMEILFWKPVDGLVPSIKKPCSIKILQLNCSLILIAHSRHFCHQSYTFQERYARQWPYSQGKRNCF